MNSPASCDALCPHRYENLRHRNHSRCALRSGPYAQVMPRHRRSPRHRDGYCISSDQLYALRGNTGVPRPSFGTLSLLEHRYNGLGKYVPPFVICILVSPHVRLVGEATSAGFIGARNLAVEFGRFGKLACVHWLCRWLCHLVCRWLCRLGNLLSYR